MTHSCCTAADSKTKKKLSKLAKLAQSTPSSSSSKQPAIEVDLDVLADGDADAAPDTVPAPSTDLAGAAAASGGYGMVLAAAAAADVHSSHLASLPIAVHSNFLCSTLPRIHGVPCAALSTAQVTRFCVCTPALTSAAVAGADTGKAAEGRRWVSTGCPCPVPGLMGGLQHPQVMAITGLQLVQAVCLQFCTANRITSSLPVHHTHQHQVEKPPASQLTHQHSGGSFSD